VQTTTGIVYNKGFFGAWMFIVDSKSFRVFGEVSVTGDCISRLLIEAAPKRPEIHILAPSNPLL
jgi:hypothetical protein